MTNVAAPSDETKHSSSATAPDADLVFRPVAVAGGFMYQLPDGRHLPRDVLERLADIGMLRRVFSERVNTCPECGSGNILFREVCPHCEGAGIEQPEVIHHFRCAGVFRTDLFGDPEAPVCPKCRHQLRHVGVDHEYLEAEFACATCGKASSVVPTKGRCMECGHHFAAEDAGSDDWYDYLPTENWDATILGDGALSAGEQGMPVVLIVDDTEDNLDLLEDLLDGHAVKVIRASSGPEAIHVTSRGRLDLVILDVNMPEMDGFEAARRLRRTEFGADVPIIYLTAFRTSDRDLVTGLGAGANDYVTKPFSKNDLLARVEVLLRRGSSAHR